MSQSEVTLALDRKFKLGEGPVWDSARNRVLWVDILEGLVFEADLTADLLTITKQHQFDSMVGAAVPSSSGGILVATHTELIHIKVDGTREIVLKIISDSKLRRLNDGAVDKFGNFLIGTLSLSGPPNCEFLYRLTQNGELEVIDSGLTLSNGIGWSPQGDILYNVDTIAGQVWKRRYGPTLESLGARELLIQFDGEYPDGMCIDSEGSIWIAIWGAGQIRKFTPSGNHTFTIYLESPHTTSAAFVGQDLQTLVITSATKDLTVDQLAQFPNSGKIFIYSSPVAGLPSYLWRG